MGLPISGKSGNRADVNKKGEILSSVAAAPEITRNALAKGDAYAWHSQDSNVDAADTLLTVRNDSGSQDLVIDRIQITGGNVASRYEIHKITANAAFSAGGIGAAIVAMNLGNSGKIPDASGYKDDIGNIQGTVFMEVAVGVTITKEFDVGIVLSKTQMIAVDQVTANTAGAATFFGYFVDRN